MYSRRPHMDNLFHVCCSTRSLSDEKSFFHSDRNYTFPRYFRDLYFSNLWIVFNAKKKRLRSLSPLSKQFFFALFSRSWHSATSSSNPFTKFSFFSAVKIKEIALPSLTVRATGTKWDFPIYVFACLSTVQIEECEAWNNFPKASWSVGMLDSRSF